MGVVMKTLLSIPELPSTKTGGGVLLHELLHFLAVRGAVDVVLPVAPHQAADFEQLGAAFADLPVGWHTLEAQSYTQVGRLRSGLPVEVLKNRSEDNCRCLEDLRRRLEPDCELLISSWALGAYRGSCLPPKARLYMVNVDPEIIRPRDGSFFRKIEAWWERRCVKGLCRKALQGAGAAAAITSKDAAVLGRWRGAPVEHLPPLMRPKPVERSGARKDVLLITTNYTYDHNRRSLDWFLGEVWPRLPGFELWITGRDNADHALARQVADLPRVHYRGLLETEAFEACFREAGLCINPTRSGSGFQIKLLDALCRGVPVVSTEFSNPFPGVIPSSDDPEELAKLIQAQLAGASKAFDYEAFYADAVHAWEKFLGVSAAAPQSIPTQATE